MTKLTFALNSLVCQSHRLSYLICYVGPGDLTPNPNWFLGYEYVIILENKSGIEYE